MNTLTSLPIDDVLPHPRNVRREVTDLEEIAASIAVCGILQPLTVAPQDGHYVIIAGHRRLAAARLAGLSEVPCVIREDLANNLLAQLESQIIENVMRSDLTIMEEADAYQQLELLGATEVSIAKSTGRSRGTVRQRLLLAGLPTPRREQFEKGQLSLDGAVKCARLREKWVDDAEILSAIDSCGSHSFGGDYWGIDRVIERILDGRKPQPELDEGDEPDGEALDVTGQRAEWEERERARNDRYAARKEAAKRMYGWLSGRISSKDDTLARKLITLALEDVITEYDLRDALPIMGIEPCGEDEDDANQRITAATKALAATDQVVLLALAITGIDDLSPYNYNDHVEKLQQLGYAPTKADRACLDVAT